MQKSLALFISLSAAMSETAFAGWGTKNTSITGYCVWSTGFAAIQVTDMENPDHCSVGNYLVLDNTAPSFNALWAIVLSAYAIGSKVILSCNGYAGNYPLINSIAVPAS